MNAHETWLKQAQSNLNMARLVTDFNGIRLEDVCFQLQQCVEKSLKGLLVFLNEQPPKTHSITLLLELLTQYLTIPDYIRETIDLNDYSVTYRYPGAYSEMTDIDEVARLLIIAEDCIRWVVDEMNNR